MASSLPFQKSSASEEDGWGKCQESRLELTTPLSSRHHVPLGRSMENGLVLTLHPGVTEGSPQSPMCPSRGDLGGNLAATARSRTLRP